MNRVQRNLVSKPRTSSQFVSMQDRGRHGKSARTKLYRRSSSFAARAAPLPLAHALDKSSAAINTYVHSTFGALTFSPDDFFGLAERLFQRLRPDYSALSTGACARRWMPIRRSRSHWPK